MNASGQIVGTSATASGAPHATLWELGPPDTTPPPPPIPDPYLPFLRLKGYGNATDQVLTTANHLFGNIGSFNGQPSLFISTVDLNTSERWIITLVPPAGTPLAPGTYTNAGGTDAFPLRPVVHVIHFAAVRHRCRQFTLSRQGSSP